MREVDLCDSFAVRARESGWVVYPETGGWDLLLVAASVTDVEAGTQVGVSAKVRANVEVIAQAMAPTFDAWPAHGPDFRAVLVPRCSHDFHHVCEALRLHVYRAENRHGEALEPWQRAVACPPDSKRRVDAKRVTLPPVVPSWSGGAPSPKTLSRWRVGALRLCTLLRSRGFITPADFKAQKVDRSRWVAIGWVRGEGPRGQTRYVPGPKAFALPDVGYEAERDALAALDSKEATCAA